MAVASVIIPPKSGPLCSVVIPTYHEEKYIVQTLRDLAEQTLFSQCEIVIADYDPARDMKTYSAIYNAFKADSRFNNKIKFVNVFHDGIGFARHTGTMAATGKYITAMDADSRFGSRNDLGGIIAAMESGRYVMIHNNNLIKPEEMKEEHTAEANQLYVWRNEFGLNSYVPFLAYEPGMTFLKSAYLATDGWPDVILGEGPILGWKFVMKFGPGQIKHMPNIIVYVSGRRAAGSKQGILLDLNYHHAYR